MMPDRLDEYFVDEAGDFLGQLRLLLATPGWPDVDELLRLTRGIRGSTEMVGAETVSRVATALDEGARAVAEGRIDPADGALEAVRETAMELRHLLTAIHDWDADDDARAARCLSLWSAINAASVDGSSAATPPLLVTGQNAGVTPGETAPVARSPDDPPVIPIGLLALQDEPLRTVPIAALLADPGERAGVPAVPIGSLAFDGPSEARAIVTVEPLNRAEMAAGGPPVSIRARFRNEDASPGAPAGLAVAAIAGMHPPDGGAPPLVPIATLLTDGDEEPMAVPIERLLLDEALPEEEALAIVPIATLLATDAGEAEAVPVGGPSAGRDEPALAVPIADLLAGAVEPLALVPIGILLQDDDGPVVSAPIEALLAGEEEELEVVPVTSLLAEDDTVPAAEPIDDLVFGAGIAALIGVAPGADAASPEDLVPRVPVGALLLGEEETPTIPVESLVLRGDSAIRWALALRSVIETAARGEQSGEQSLPELVSELFDLLELSLVADLPEV